MSPEVDVDTGADAGEAVIVFDGTCVLCNGWVDFLLRHDRRRRYRFAAMQGAAGRALLARHGLDPDNPASFLLLEDAHAWTDTDGIRRVLAGLGGVWMLAHLMVLVPRRLRDAIYRRLALNRYRWFGTTACRIPDETERMRFLD